MSAARVPSIGETPPAPLEKIPSQTAGSPTSSLYQKPNNEVEFNPGRRFFLAFAVLATLTLMVAIDGTSISVALPIIAKKLNGTAIEAFWAGTSFLLTSTVFQPNYASFSHIFGRKPMVLVAVTMFFIGVMIAAFANNFALLLVGRSLQGVGGGGIIAMTEIIVTDLVPLRFRGQWVGIISGMW
jgi:MFS family permease